ncbi:hypothetical protein [Serratia grimesii]|uniref:hypothetical protein n=1 Tax=Serratia grimesii TaxID=82995 RepID=UPI00077C1187|nr:hypothetical protein [Serratia grimesii]CAI0727589.1 Uncharacterised protein [Serratia grimesii]CAI2444754.1 Uncharacterised protein [Serratia grimesii]SUI32677.1 Uncharacterised protein [Serratia grimesii]
MADFMGSINDGLNAARQAEVNKAEINDVFKELNNQLSVATGGRVSLVRTKFYKESPTAYHSLAASVLGQARETYPGLGISHNNSEHKLSAIEVAKWEMDKNGYPCVIKIGSNELYCEDKGALEQGLAALMRDPDVGTAILKYMKFGQQE